MTNILNYILGGLLFLSIALGATLWFQNNSLEKQVLTNNATITTLTVQKDALQWSNDGLVTAIKTQNTSVEKLGEIQKTITALFTNFNESVTTTNKQIAGIKAGISKETPPTTCAATIQYLKDARKEYK